MFMHKTAASLIFFFEMVFPKPQFKLVQILTDVFEEVDNTRGGNLDEMKPGFSSLIIRFIFHCIFIHLKQGSRDLF